MDIIYQTKGKHFKVYNNYWSEVLEHPSDTEEVSLSFGFENDCFTIHVEDYIHQPMRIPGQKERIDIYLLQDNFTPLINLVEDYLLEKNIVFNPKREWKFGNPIHRDSRQKVPQLNKLAEVKDVRAIVPFKKAICTLSKAYCVVDSEIPGNDQTKWKREGGSRQIHIGIFMGQWLMELGSSKDNKVSISFPISEMKYNFIDSLRVNWVN